jgi:carbon storage regulator
MLVLTRKPGEQIVVGENIVITILKIHGNRVQLGVDAPSETPICRNEILNRSQHSMPCSKHRSELESPYFAECA